MALQSIPSQSSGRATYQVRHGSRACCCLVGQSRFCDAPPFRRVPAITALAAVAAARKGQRRKRQQSGDIGALEHFGILAELVRNKIFPPQRRRPCARPQKPEFQADLEEVGLGVVSVPRTAVATLLPVLERLRGGECKEGETIPRFSRAGGLNGAFPSTMTWHWAAEDAALEPFQPMACAVAEQLGPGFELVAASFVIAEGSCFDGQARMHLDFGPPQIPSDAACTALMPLYPEVFPESEGNLEYVPWNGEGEVDVHLYQQCEAAVFYGKLPHRTQPFDAAAFSPSLADKKGHPLHGLRVLASLSFAKLSGDAPWRNAVEQVLLGYGAPLLPPLGTGR